MLKFVAGTIVMAIGAMVGVAFAQDMALLSPAVPSASLVYDPCKTISENPEMADPQNGTCVGAARELVASLSRDVDPAAADQAIADAVAAIAALAMADPACSVFHDEIAAAIRVLGTRSSTAEQAAQITEIAKTIEDCALGATADILPDDPTASSSPA